MSIDPAAIKELVAAGGRQPYLHVTTSPDGRHAVVTVANEMRMSLWVEHGALYRVADGECIAEFGDSMWSLDCADWKDNVELELVLSRYPGKPGGIRVLVDIEQGSCILKPMNRISSLANISQALDDLVVKPARYGI